jgi:ferric-dicitrate binding protein FerR (iron transport regulator)
MTLTDDSFMNLGPGSAVRVNQYSFDPVSNRRTTIIRVLEGKVRFVVFRIRRGDSSFRVEADKALVLAGGLADFVVTTSPGQAEVAALESSLNVRNTLPYVIGNVNIGMNQRTVVKEKVPPTAPVVITPQERKNWLKDLKQN